jgi:hypothetical protein
MTNADLKICQLDKAVPTSSPALPSVAPMATRLSEADVAPTAAEIPADVRLKSGTLSSECPPELFRALRVVLFQHKKQLLMLQS